MCYLGLVERLEEFIKMVFICIFRLDRDYIRFVCFFVFKEVGLYGFLVWMFEGFLERSGIDVLILEVFR